LRDPRNARRSAVLVSGNRDVREAGGVVDRDVDELPVAVLRIDPSNVQPSNRT
jgi:hypothetical protein